MKDQYTHITMLVDRSGSMDAIRTDAEGGVNSFIDKQKDVEGEATLMLYDFDGTYAGNTDWHRLVFKGDLKDAPRYTLEPRGNTALRDAMHRSIVDTGAFLSAMDEADRPAHVVFVVMTDGQENASREITPDALRHSIELHTDKYSWEFVFLGAGLQVAQQAVHMGIRASNVTNVAPGSGAAMATAYFATSDSVANLRTKGVATYAGKINADGSVAESDAERTEVQQ